MIYICSTVISSNISYPSTHCLAEKVYTCLNHACVFPFILFEGSMKKGNYMVCQLVRDKELSRISKKKCIDVRNVRRTRLNIAQVISI